MQVRGWCDAGPQMVRCRSTDGAIQVPGWHDAGLDVLMQVRGWCDAGPRMEKINVTS